LRKEAAITDIADIYALASAKKSVAPRAVPMELKPLISPYRKHGRFTLRIENLPQSARLSAGQNNGDRTWSLALDELDDLFYFPPTGFDNEHTLAIRVITKDETGASTIALIDYRIKCAGDSQCAVPSLPQRVTRKSEPLRTLQDDGLQKEILLLKDTLAERDLELNRLRVSREQINAQLTERLDASLAEAESVWRREEALRLDALETALQEQFELKLAEAKQRPRADANISNEGKAAALQNVQLDLATVKDTLANREAALSKLQTQMERLRQDSKMEMRAAKVDAQSDLAAEIERRNQVMKALAEVMARCESAEASLASAQAVSTVTNHEDELNLLRSELEVQRREADAEISAVKVAAEVRAAERLKAAQAQWQQSAAKERAEITARYETAEAALAAARASPVTNHENELNQLRSEFEVQRMEMAAQIAAIKAAAAVRSAERMQSAQAEWQQSAAKERAEITARCETAEAALVAARGNTQTAEMDEYVRGLNREIKSLQATLVDREAALAQAHASLEQMRFGAARETPALPRLSHPRMSFGPTNQTQGDKADSHLVRDVVIVFAVVMAAVLLFPQFETVTPSDHSWHIETAGGPSQDAPKPATSAPLTPAAMKYPTATILREVNLRTLPSVSADVLASLKSGTQIAILENRGNWDRVQIAGEGGTVQQGWVYHSYLAEAGK